MNLRDLDPKILHQLSISQLYDFKIELEDAIELIQKIIDHKKLVK